MPTYSNGAGYFLYVSDISEVYSYNVPQGNTMFFMNKSQPVLYIKSVDVFNQQTVDSYDLVKRSVPEPKPFEQSSQVPPQYVPQSDFVRRDELASIIAETIRNEMRSQNNRGRNREQKENN